MTEVWVMDFNAEGPEPGDYDGWQSVHASREGAVEQLAGRFQDNDMECGPDLAEAIAMASAFGEFATADNGSFSGGFERDGVEFSFSVHRMPVEP